jgi:hypothetical protein
MKHIFIEMVILALLCAGSLAYAAEGPVAIKFDPDKKPFDLRTGEAVKPCTQVHRGSIQFYMAHLYEPLDHLTFFKEGVRTIPKDRLWKIVKEQERWDIWRPWYKGGHDGYPITQNMRTMGVSFIPLDENGNPGEKVLIRFSDLQEIDWGID